MGILTKHEQWLIFSLAGIIVFGTPLAGLLKTFPGFSRRISFLETVSAPSVRDLNAVTFEELLTIPGVGRSTAEKIIRYRMANGDFQDVVDLKKVPGLNAHVIKRISPYLTLRLHASRSDQGGERMKRSESTLSEAPPLMTGRVEGLTVGQGGHE